VGSWADVAVVRAQSLTQPVDPTAAWTVLRPAHALPARWDAARQSLAWPLLDAAGEAIVLDVPWSRLHAHATGRIEALGDRLPDGALVVARVHRVCGDLVGEPLSVVHPRRSINPVDALHFDEGAAPVRSSLVARLLSAGAPDAVTEPEPPTGPTSMPIRLAELRSLVEREAQRGCAGSVPGSVHGRLASAHAALRRDGYSLFVEPDGHATAAESLLRSLYLVQQVERALA
jgi:hypothetical protein